VLLFTVSFLWRRYAVAAQADTLALREQDRGDVELSGALIRLSLTGSRGVATSVLWMSAIEKQKKNQWNEMEFFVRSLTKLQPHFITPWLFQSWNLSYNVAVESDRISDKYFYVTRGIQLLADGERQNRHNPAMRFSIGFYTQHKICNSDESNVMRSLFQLSCMPPNQRDPARFRKYTAEGDEEFDWDEFEKFCKENPQLVRRLREATRKEAVASERDQLRQQKAQFTCETADEVVAFLAANYRVPSIYEEATPTPPGARWKADRQDRLRPDPLDRFPVLPPGGSERPTTPPQHVFIPAQGFNELTAARRLPDGNTEGSTLDDGTDPFDVSRAWFGYAQEPLPDPDDFYPGRSQPITNRVVQRPAKITQILFRQYPPLTQTQKAQRLQLEGWFDETPWLLTGWFPSRIVKSKVNGQEVDIDLAPDMFRKGDGAGDAQNDPPPTEASLKLKPERTAQKTWDYAYQMWQRHGQRNHLLLEGSAGVNLRQDAANYFRYDFKNGKPGDPPAPLAVDPETLPEEQRRRWKAAAFLFEYERARHDSNFAHHILRARIERRDDATTARRLFYEAEGLRLKSEYDSALELYRSPDALDGWRDKVLLNPEFPEYRKDRFIQEDTYGVQLTYLLILNRQYGQGGRRFIVEFSTLMTSSQPVPGAPLLPLYQPLFVLDLMNPTPTRNPNLELLTTKREEWFLFRGPYDFDMADDERMTPVLATILTGKTASPAGLEPLSFLAAYGTKEIVPKRPFIDPETARQVKEMRGLIRPQPPAPPGQDQSGPRGGPQ
jgi:hypothetical protein